MLKRTLFAGLLGFLAAAAPWTIASACPFCSASALTLSEQVDAADVAIIATLTADPKPLSDDAFDPTAELEKLPFRVDTIIKGEKLIEAGQTVEMIYFGDAGKGSKFLMLGYDPKKLAWSSPISLSARAVEYVLDAVKLEKTGHDRLAFFQNHFEDGDPMLTVDAYDEFAKASYQDIIALKDQMHRDRYIAWIKDPEVPASRRRMYLTLLSVCGVKDDVAMLESLLLSDDRRDKAGLDALASCYLMLRGEEGMTLLEDHFLKNEKADVTDVNSIILALRFHGQEKSPIPKKRLVAAMRLMLERPQLVDLIIPDLARWEDWESMPRLVQMFKESDERTTYIRVPVIQYLRACASPDAKAPEANAAQAKNYLDELAKLDPKSFKRADSFFSFGVQPAAPEQAPNSDAASSDQAPKSEQSTSKQPEIVAPELKE